MELLDKLAAAATSQHEAGLPASLVEDILALCAVPVLAEGKADLLELLLQQVEDFDSYAGAGCFGDSVSAATIEGTVNRLRGRG
ncbi:GSU3529 family protein [Geomonas anaerohicana]|uniref:Addiction module component n=1 Tax=Geomonas anaerohicana TaxID=2798583 RepID=A0ABS0Y8F3_9BACT|nr:hypothetical protein [Geomonas anaerohicana]MBJ6748593.1 hypothetical protein [Geomonas anaerohicana]